MTLVNDNGYYYGAQIVVGNGGLLQATGTAFNAPGNNTNGGNYTQIIVNSGGHLQASGSTFALGQVYLADGVVFNAGDLTGDGFDSPLYIPAIDVQYLSGPANNLRFQSIDVQADTIVSGETLALNCHRHADHDQPPLRLPRRPHRQPGGIVTAAANVPVVFSGGLTVNQGAASPSAPATP